MRNLLVYISIVFLLSPFSVFGQSQCEQDRIIAKVTKIASLKDYYIEKTSDIPSTATFIVKGKELNLIADPEDIENNLKNKEGRNFQISYEKVYGWLGDGCNEYQRLVGSKQIK